MKCVSFNLFKTKWLCRLLTVIGVVAAVHIAKGNQFIFGDGGGRSKKIEKKNTFYSMHFIYYMKILNYIIKYLLDYNYCFSNIQIYYRKKYCLYTYSLWKLEIGPLVLIEQLVSVLLLFLILEQHFQLRKIILTEILSNIRFKVYVYNTNIVMNNENTEIVYKTYY